MTLNELRQRYFNFFASKGHRIIPSASLLPENDPTTLFTGSGMQPLMPYLLGAPHPDGRRLVNSQKCFRAEDIEEVGDNRHTTFFEMLGNWSLGDYFKSEQLEWFFTFLVEELLIDPSRLFVSVFIGEPSLQIPKDTEAAELWKSLFRIQGIEAKEAEIGSVENGGRNGMSGGRILYYDSSKNWWSRAGNPDRMPVGEPGGPDSEVFYDFRTPHDPAFGAQCHPNCDCGRFVEIGNSVFMQYRKREDGGFDPLPQKNVDFGGGLERLAAAANGEGDIFRGPVFREMIAVLERQSGKSYVSAPERERRAFRMIADHLRGACFMIAEGMIPSNTEQGYLVRRLLRRAVRNADLLGLHAGELKTGVDPVAELYAEAYPGLHDQQEAIKATIADEEEKFRRTLSKGLKEFEKIAAQSASSGLLDREAAFQLFATYGFPLDLIVECAKERHLAVDTQGFKEEFQRHQERSRTDTVQKFKGGLVDQSDQSVKYHTATHLLHEALREVLGAHVEQRGSNITPERMRFDFSHQQKMTAEELEKVEALVNQKIREDLPVSFEICSVAEAKKRGAIGLFEERYGDQVKIYRIGDFSHEICGGPHVERTGVLGVFTIVQETASSAGVRRIKAMLK